jgi:DNA-3-methyladenine glycosylase II
MNEYDALAASDADMTALIAAHGRPDPFTWASLEAAAGGKPFPELALHIVSQQLSTAAALTIYGRVTALAGDPLEPGRLLEAPVEALRAAGLSGAKSASLRDLAERVLDGRLSFERLAGLDDAAAQAELEEVRGIGPWSAQMFLLHFYRRPDMFPAADIGLLRGAQSAFGLSERPSADELAARAERWRPYRSYAAALLWANSQ